MSDTNTYLIPKWLRTHKASAQPAKPCAERGSRIRKAHWHSCSPSPLSLQEQQAIQPQISQHRHIVLPSAPPTALYRGQTGSQCEAGLSSDLALQLPADLATDRGLQDPGLGLQQLDVAQVQSALLRDLENVSQAGSFSGQPTFCCNKNGHL